MSAIDDAVADAIDRHFDPQHGAPFWLDRARALGLDPRRQIRSLADLDILGALDAADLDGIGCEALLPADARARRTEWILSETGGTRGRPLRTVFLRDEFEAAFVRSFVAAADASALPRGEAWLWIGPSGPHIIGKAARACAAALDGPDPFAVDFDPRWFRKLPDGSVARERYIEHVLSQARAILEAEAVGAIFATPPILARLIDDLRHGPGERIRGIHIGGMRVPAALRHSLAEACPRAVLIAGYGNSLFGVAPEWPPLPQPPRYFPLGTRWLIEVRRAEGSGAPLAGCARPLPPLVAPGERGRLYLTRLDASVFLPRLAERDEGLRVLADPGLARYGVLIDGVCDPGPPPETRARDEGGIY